MTPPSPPTPHPSPDGPVPPDDNELVDLLASLALDDVHPQEELVVAAAERGIAPEQVIARRDEFAGARRSLVAATPDRTDHSDELGRRRNNLAVTERAVSAAMAAATAAAASTSSAVDVPTDSAVDVPSRPRPSRRLAPVLVAASIVAVAGFGALALGGPSEPGEDLASTDDAASTAESDLSTQAGATDGARPSTTAALLPEGDDEDLVQAPEAMAPDEAVELGDDLTDLGSVADLKAAYAAADLPLLRSEGTAPSASTDAGEIDSCARSLGTEPGRAVATITVAGVDHLVLADRADVVLVRLVDCTVAPRP